MSLNTKKLVSLTDANQNFSRVARIVDEEKSVIVTKNNKPKYVIVEFEEFAKESKSDEERLDIIADRILCENIEVFKGLAK